MTDRRKELQSDTVTNALTTATPSSPPYSSWRWGGGGGEGGVERGGGGCFVSGLCWSYTDYR